MGVLLSKPNTEKVFDEGTNGVITYAACSMQGWRTSMEDAHCADLDLDGNKSVFFGVYDGHAGTDVAIYSSRFLHKNVAGCETFKKKDFESALKEGFLKTDADLRLESGMVECQRIRRQVARNKQQGSDDEDEVNNLVIHRHVIVVLEKGKTAVNGSKLTDDDEIRGLTESGSTAVTCLMVGKNLYCANAGDSRAVLSRKGVAVGLSDDHKPFNDIEKARIEKAGGFVEDKRVNGTLAVARAMGDFSFKAETQLKAEEQQVTCDPEIRKFTLAPGDDFMILACDGIWDMLSSQQAVDLVAERLKKSIPLPEILSDLFDACLSPHPSVNEGLGCDNMTAIIVMLDKSSS